MPRKCCTLWDGKACRSNYDTTKTMPQMKVTTFSFPEDPNERESWIKSLPNILTCQVSKNIGICEKHFPPDCPRVKKRGGSCVPVVPPSIFGTTKSSLFVQTNFSPRAVITAESRRLNEEARKLEADRIASFDQIFNYCTKFSPEHILIQESNAVKIVKLNGWPPEVDYSILVTNDRRVRGLTGDTSNALHVTLLGLVDLIKVLLDKHKYSYVLPGKFSSDRIEGEFGICRQSSGGNYLISAEQVINSLRLQRIKLYNKLDIDGEKNLIENERIV